MNMEKIAIMNALITRFKKIRGQIGGIRKMLATPEKDCTDIFIQLSAVRAALDKASMLVLENHMLHCLTPAATEEDLKEQRDNLISFIKHYKYGTFSSPYNSQEVDYLFLEAERIVTLVIDTIQEAGETRCADVLGYTSQIREILNSASLAVFESEVHKSLYTREPEHRISQLEKTLGMAKKFIV